MADWDATSRPRWHDWPAPGSLAGMAVPAPPSIREIPDFRGQAAYEVSTPAATWVFHQHGGGLAALVDPDGRDWIGYRPGGGSAGEYRGIPNMVHPGEGFHPGGGMCETTVADGSDGTVALDVTADGWACRWEFAADRAILRLTRAAGPYWWLYEGTPGGTFDAGSLKVVDSAGHVAGGGETWQRRLPEPRGVGFVTAASPYALLLLDRTERAADVVDSYWPMEGNMTVFGFGRKLGGAEDPRWRHLTETPATLVVSLRRVDAAGVPAALAELGAV